MNPRQFQEKRVSVTQACDLVEHITTRAGTTSEVESRDGIIRFQDEASVPTQHTQPLLVCTSLQIKITYSWYMLGQGGERIERN